MAEYPKTRITLPRGIRLLPLKKGQPSPFGCSWRVSGKRKAAYFKTIGDLETRLRELKSARAQGEIGRIPTADELMLWRTFIRGCDGVNPLVVLTECKAARSQAGRPTKSLNVEKAVTEYLAVQAKRQEKGTITADSLRQRNRKLISFKEAFASFNLEDITSEKIEDWIDSLEAVAAVSTFNDYRKRLAVFFDYFKSDCPSNPAKKVERRIDLSENEKVMPVEDIKRLLEYARAHQPEVLVRLAAEVFTGLRFTSSAKLEKQHVNFTRKNLKLPKHVMKTRRSHLFEPPEAFWAWAKIGAEHPEGWKMSASQWMHAKSRLFKEAEVDHPSNGLRHSFCSYHVAANESPSKTAYILAHTNEGLLWSTYKGMASKDEGEAFLNLRPDPI